MCVYVWIYLLHAYVCIYIYRTLYIIKYTTIYIAIYIAIYTAIYIAIYIYIYIYVYVYVYIYTYFIPRQISCSTGGKIEKMVVLQKPRFRQRLQSTIGGSTSLPTLPLTAQPSQAVGMGSGLVWNGANYIVYFPMVYHPCSLSTKTRNGGYPLYSDSIWLADWGATSSPKAGLYFRCSGWKLGPPSAAGVSISSFSVGGTQDVRNMAKLGGCGRSPQITISFNAKMV